MTGPNTAKTLAAIILHRLETDGTKDDAKLVIVYQTSGAFRRILLNETPSPTTGPKEYMTGASLRALCEAVIEAPTTSDK